MMSNKINIVCAADEAYAMAQTVCLKSALHYLTPHGSLQVYFLDGGIKSKTIQKIKKACKIQD